MEKLRMFKLTDEQKESIKNSSFSWSSLLTDSKLLIIEAVMNKDVSIAQATKIVRENLRMIYFQDYNVFKKEEFQDKNAFDEGGNFCVWYYTDVEDIESKREEYSEFTLQQIIYAKIFLNNIDLTDEDNFFELGIDKVNEYINSFTEDLYNLHCNKLMEDLKEFEIEVKEDE